MKKNAGRCRRNEIISTLPSSIRNAYKRECDVHSKHQSFSNRPRRKQHEMKCLVLFFLAVVLVAAEGKVVPASDVETQQTGTQSSESTLTDRFREAQNIISSLGTQLQEQFNLPHQSDLLTTIQEHTNNFAKNVTEYLKNVSEEVSEYTNKCII